LPPLPSIKLPNANDDSATTTENTSVTIDVLNSDSDPDEDSLVITNVSIIKPKTRVMD